VPFASFRFRLILRAGSFFGLCSQELNNSFIRSNRLIGSENVTRAWNYHDFRTGNAFRNQFAVLRWDKPVRFSVNQERRRSNL
jgi:hypothetical protein